MKTVKLAFLLALLVAQVAVALPVAAQNPRLNRQQPGGQMEGGGYEPVEQPLRPNRQTIQDQRQVANRSILQVQPGVLFQVANPAFQMSGMMLGTPVRKWPSLWDTCPDVFFQGKDRRIVAEMERNLVPVFTNSIDGPKFLPSGLFRAAGNPVSSGAFAFNLPKIDAACGLSWVEFSGADGVRNGICRFQRCDAQGRPVGPPEVSTMITTDEVFWPIPGYTGCDNKGGTEIPICSGPMVWFAVGDRVSFLGASRFEFSLSIGPRKIATIITPHGEVFYQYFQ